MDSKGSVLTEFVDQVVAGKRLEPITTAVCDEIETLLQKLDASEPIQDSAIVMHYLREHRETTLDKEEECLRSLKEHKKSGIAWGQPLLDLTLVVWIRIRFWVLSLFLLRCLHLGAQCRKTTERIMRRFRLLRNPIPLLMAKPECSDSVYVSACNDEKDWIPQYRRLRAYFKRKSEDM